MDQAPTADTRQRVLSGIQEVGSLLGMIPGLLDENEQMRVRMERTRQEADAIREELVAVKNEVGALRKERDDTTRMCTNAMSEVAGVINEMITKLRPAQNASPFTRAPAAAEAPSPLGLRRGVQDVTYPHP